MEPISSGSQKVVVFLFLRNRSSPRVGLLDPKWVLTNGVRIFVVGPENTTLKAGVRFFGWTGSPEWRGETLGGGGGLTRCPYPWLLGIHRVWCFSWTQQVVFLAAFIFLTIKKGYPLKHNGRALEDRSESDSAELVFRELAR